MGQKRKSERSTSTPAPAAPSTARPRGWWLAVAWAIGSLAALVVVLAMMTIDRADTAPAGRANLRALWPFWFASASGWCALGTLWVMLRRGGHGDGDRETGAQAGRFARTALLILGVALTARGVVLFTHEPVLSDDVYRYVFDGRNLAAGENPYLTRPEDRTHAFTVIPIDDDAQSYAERWTGESVVARVINNPELYTIYLPTSQWVFALAGLVVPEAWSDVESSVRVFRAIFVLIELLAMVFVLAALRNMGRSAWWLILYAWHPLPITEIAGSGHQDVIGIALLALGMLLYTATPARVGRWIWTIALAVLVKPIALPVALVLLKGRSWRRWLTAGIIGAVVCAAVAIPLLLTHEGEPIDNLRATAERFSLKWAHFGSIYEPALTTIGSITPEWTNDQQEQLARTLCIGLLGLVILGVWLRGRDAWADCAIIFLAMILLAPAAHSWYLLWALILMPVALNPAVWVASLTLPWGYAVLADTQDWTVPWWVMLIAYLPIYATLVFDLLRRWRTEGP